MFIQARCPSSLPDPFFTQNGANYFSFTDNWPTAITPTPHWQQQDPNLSKFCCNGNSLEAKCATRGFEERLKGRFLKIIFALNSNHREFGLDFGISFAPCCKMLFSLNIGNVVFGDVKNCDSIIFYLCKCCFIIYKRDIHIAGKWCEAQRVSEHKKFVFSKAFSYNKRKLHHLFPTGIWAGAWWLSKHW